jgi:hypothetical protein
MPDDIVICSFHTADDHYRSFADRLRTDLTELGVTHEIGEVVKGDGEDWADICRKKVGDLSDVCARHSEQKVFWVDVDCHVLGLPDYVVDFSADLIGFQRGFGGIAPPEDLRPRSGWHGGSRPGRRVSTDPS